MKKITLLFCFAFASFVGMAQEVNTSAELKSDQEISIEIFTTQNTDVAQDLDFNLSEDTYSEENMSHELVHNQPTAIASKDNFIGDNFTYNEYVLNESYEMVTVAIQKL